MKVDRNTSANTPTRMMNGDRHVACVDSFVFFNTSHLAWTGPDLVSVGAYWQTEGVGRQMHCEKVRQSEAGGGNKWRDGHKKPDELTGPSEHVS